MHQIIAIAMLSLRNAVRSKIVLSLMVMLLAVVVLMPLTIKGDGTVAGLIQILLSYTLGLAGLILSLTSLWAGCAAVASDVQDKSIQMVATKPVASWQLWLGKWLGLMVMNVALVAVSGGATYSMLRWHLHPERLTDPARQREAAELLAARIEVRPVVPDTRDEARQRLETRLARDPLPPGTTARDVLKALEQQVAIEQQTVRPAGQQRWTFPPVLIDRASAAVTLQYRFSSSLMGVTGVKGRWLAGTDQQPVLLEVARESVPRALNTISLELDERWRGKPLVLTYIDMDPAGGTVLFDLHDGLRVLAPHRGFDGNFARALLVMLGQVAFFTALGVTAGCLFSLPVAAFVSLFLLLLVQMASYIEGIAGNELVLPWQTDIPGEAMPWGTVLVTLVFKGLAMLLSPLVQESVLEHLATGRFISYAWTVRGLLVQGVLYALVMCAVSAGIMNRRELALPGSS